jgi:putative RNA 2'-phosphotransferase
MRPYLIQLSKTMAYALRHQPAQFGLTLDEEGWVSVGELADALRRHRRDWQDLRVEDFTEVIAQSEKPRYELREGKIRAYYGHSTPQKITQEATFPPAILFHGTTPYAARSIHVEGLKPMKRQYVHLSADEETARQVALRRTHKPIILRVSALEAYQQGVKFYLGNDLVWLAEPIPAQFIREGHGETG